MFKVKAKDLCFLDVKAEAKDTLSSRTSADSLFHHFITLIYISLK